LRHWREPALSAGTDGAPKIAAPYGLSPTSAVRRSDGTPVATSASQRNGNRAVPAAEAPGRIDQVGADPTDSRTVLVIDDDPTLRRSVGRILDLYGYEVMEAQSADDAFTILAGHPGPIDLVLCDLVLPGLSGREAASVILARRPDSHVLFMSGYSSHGSARRELVLAGESFLSKPFGVSELLAAVETAIDGPSARGAAS
jgi:two-component system, cell cycle sensor histidine kinase and response regulator CckA